MNNTTHTPGPWYPHYAKADHCLSSSVWGKEPGNQVAVIGGKSLETMNANAALIAAAPAMYEALVEMVELRKQLAIDHPHLFVGKAVLLRAETALAQAEGRR